MTVDALNMVSDNDTNEAVEVYPSENAWTTGRSDQYIYDFTKSYIPTTKRIYKIPKLQIKGVPLVADTNSPNSGSSAYNFHIKYRYYNTGTEPFPFENGDEIGYYVDADDSNLVYTYDNTTKVYTGDAGAQDPNTVVPRIVFYATSSDFPVTGVAYVTYIARDTGIAYKYTTSYVTLANIDSDGSVIIELSSTDRLVEKNKYNTLDTDDSDRLDPTTNYKSNTLYYTYREKNIPIGATFGIFDTDTSLEYILQIKIFELLKEDGIIDSSSDYTDVTVSFTTPIDDTLFKVHYVPIPKSTRFNIDRQDITDVYKKSTIISNQQSRIVNTNNFIDNVQGKINKIGNSELKLSNRVTDVSDIYNVSDYTDENFVLTNKEIIFFKDFLDCNYELSRNWNMLSQFISVNSEIRQWEIGEQDTLKRNLLYKEFVEIDVVNSGNGIKDSTWVQVNGAKCFIDTFNINSTYEPVKNAIIDSSETTKDLICGMSSIGGGSSLLFNFQFESNAYAGNHLEELSSQIANQYDSYTDEVGKMESAVFYLYDEFEKELIYDTQKELANLYPQTDKTYIETTLIKNDSDLMIYKDNREEIGLTLQLQMINKDIQKIVLGKALSNKNRLVNENAPSTIYLKVYEDSSFGKNDRLTAPDATLGALTPTLTIDYTNYKITVTHSELDSEVQSWCLTDENNNILIAVNQDGTLLNVVTFDFNNKRTGITSFNMQKFYSLEAYSTVLGSFTASSTLAYSLRTYYAEAFSSILSSLSGSSTLGYTLRTYYADANSDELNNISGTASIGYTVRAYDLEANSGELNNITGSVVLEYTERLYSLEANSSNVSNISGTAELTYEYFLLEAYSSDVSDLTGTATLTFEPSVEWVETTPQTPTTNQCTSTSDAGNIKVESETTCAYLETNTYQGESDETTTIPPCSDGATYTLCFFHAGLQVWICTEYEGEESTEYTYYECELT
jgi:hypothetical protein